MNDILPTIEYDKKKIDGSHGRSKAYEDKDISLKVTIFPLSPKCEDALESAKNLILLIQLAKSGSLLSMDGETYWKTLSKVGKLCSEFYLLWQLLKSNENLKVSNMITPGKTAAFAFVSFIHFFPLMNKSD